MDFIVGQYPVRFDRRAAEKNLGGLLYADASESEDRITVNDGFSQGGYGCYRVTHQVLSRLRLGQKCESLGNGQGGVNTGLCHAPSVTRPRLPNSRTNARRCRARPGHFHLPSLILQAPWPRYA